MFSKEAIRSRNAVKHFITKFIYSFEYIDESFLVNASFDVEQKIIM